MAQFSVYRNSRRSAEHAPYLVEVQSDLIATELRVIVPLVNPDYFGPTMRTLNPTLQVEGSSYVLSPTEIGSLPRKVLGEPVGNLREARPQIMAALDFMIQGM
jgi:toxin CcdB